MTLLFKETAIEDILASQRYIDGPLHNSGAAKKLTRMIYDAAVLLCDNPYMGAPLNGKYEIGTDLRYLIVAKHLLFYRVSGDSVTATRVLDGRQDYMAILLSEL